MADIFDFLEEVNGDYELAKLELDAERTSDIMTRESGKGIGASLLPDYFLGPSRKNSEIFGSLGMSKKEIMDLETEMQAVALEIPAKPGCLSYKNALDFVEDASSELENRGYYTHLLHCGECRKLVFELAWFMREP